MKKTISSSFVLAAAFSAAAALPPLFENGASEWKVVVADDAAPCVKFAAQEFTNAVYRVSGALLPVVAEAPAAGPAVKIFNEGDVWGDEDVRYDVKDGALELHGNQPRAALHATYQFLMRELGVRWLWAGEDGEFYPARKTWSVPGALAYRHTPSIRFRGFHHCGDWRFRNEFLLWETRNCVNIHRHGNSSRDVKYGHYSMPSMHNANLGGEKQLFAEHPECFCEIKGERKTYNICFSSELGAQKVAERIANDIRRRTEGRFGSPVDIISIFPNDNQEYCQCAECRRLGVSTAWFRYFNKVVGILKPQFPGLRFATIAYQGYLDVPDCEFKDIEFIEYASHPRCHVHLWNDPKCAANASELKRFKQWCAKGDVPIGHYAYEYDVNSRHGMFLPFFSMINDVVDMAVENRLVTCITEVGMSPRTGPEIRVGTVRNRLTELLYAWKMYDASMTLDQFLDEVTKTAYGRAAAPMKRYFELLDAAWGAMPRHASLFADGLHLATDLLVDEKTRTGAEAALAEAEKLAADDPRSARNVLREKMLYQQITEYRDMNLGNSFTFNLPRIEQGAKPAKGAAPSLRLLGADGREGKTAVKGYWTVRPDAKKPSVTVPDRLCLGFAGAKDASVEITFDNGEKFRFAFRDGVRSERRISDVGVEVTSWKPDWKAAAGKNGVAFSIPFSAFTRQPEAGETWEVRFTAGDEAYPVKPDMNVRTSFIAAPAADRPVLYYTSESKQRDRLMRGFSSRRESAAKSGWKMFAATNHAELAELAPKADTYIFEIPDSNCVTPETAAIIREHVKNGGTFLGYSFWTVPLAKIFDDPELKSHVAAPKDFPLMDRKAKFVREGEWTTKPWDLDRTIRRGYAPCYMQVFETEGAITYAGMPLKADPSQTGAFVSALRYGKGCIILVGESLPVQMVQLIDNIRRDLGL